MRARKLETRCFRAPAAQLQRGVSRKRGSGRWSENKRAAVEEEVIFVVELRTRSRFVARSLFAYCPRHRTFSGRFSEDRGAWTAVSHSHFARSRRVAAVASVACLPCQGPRIRATNTVYSLAHLLRVPCCRMRDEDCTKSSFLTGLIKWKRRLADRRA